MSFPFGFMLGGLLVLICTIAYFNQGYFGPDYIKHWQTVCEPNGGISKIFLDGDVKCVDGAFYDINEIRSKN